MKDVRWISSISSKDLMVCLKVLHFIVMEKIMELDLIRVFILIWSMVLDNILDIMIDIMIMLMMRMLVLIKVVEIIDSNLHMNCGIKMDNLIE